MTLDCWVGQLVNQARRMLMWGLVWCSMCIVGWEERGVESSRVVSCRGPSAIHRLCPQAIGAAVKRRRRNTLVHINILWMTTNDTN